MWQRWYRQTQLTSPPRLYTPHMPVVTATAIMAAMDNYDPKSEIKTAFPPTLLVSLHKGSSSDFSALPGH